MTEKPTYFEDNYASKFLTGQTVFPDDRRIFHRPEFTYDDVAALGNACFDGQRLSVDLFFRSGQAGVLTVEPVRPGVLRLRMTRRLNQAGQSAAAAKDQPAAAKELPAADDLPAAEGQPADDQPSPMLLPFPEERPAAEFVETADAFQLRLGGYRLELDRFPFCLRVIDPAGQAIFESEWEKIVDMPTAPPMGLRRAVSEKEGAGATRGGDSSGGDFSAGAFLSWRIRNGEKLFGLGEKFTRFEKTGTRATIWEADTCGSNTTDMSYKAVPVIYSTAGWALLLHSSFRSFWELGSFSYATGGLLVEEDQLDLFLILAPTLKEQVSAYTALTGRPNLPPRWAYGLWMSRAAYTSREQMLEVANHLREEGIACDVFNIDPAWMERGYYNDIGVEVCNFNWNFGPWGAPELLFREFAELGYSICLWINPYFSEDAPLYQEAKAKGYLVRTPSGDICRLEFGLAAGIIDFTNPEAKAWWQGHLVRLLKQGAATFKVDFGDRVPEEALFFNGKSGREMHNLYVHLYAQAVYEAVQQAGADHADGKAAIWRRPGYIGSQRFPGCWAGDTQVTWEGMAGALRGGLSAAFSGEAFWSHDIGGFVGHQPLPELYIRWAQFGLLSPFARFHGTTPREPWFYGDQAMEVVRAYTRLRYSLIPYLLACGYESHQTGLPILRPMVLEFPTEPRIDAVDDQYLLGPDLLAAPVMQPGVHSRLMYLPKGPWWWFDRPGSPLSGPGFREVEAPLEHMPLFVRAGAAIPRYKTPPQHLKGPAPKEWLLDLYPGDGQRRLTIQEPGYTVQIHYTSEGSNGRIEISPAPISLAVRLIDRRPSFLRASNSASLLPGDSQTAFTIDASQGVSVMFRA